MTRKILLFFFVLICPYHAFTSEPQPKLILHFDLNRTITANDNAGGKTNQDVIVHGLAEKYKDCWDSRVPYPITFADYVKEYVLPGLPNDKELKKRRTRKISEFLLFLAEANHPLKEMIQQEFDRANSCILKQTTVVFPSFYKLLSRLQEQQIEYSIVIRTFGSELDEVTSEIEHLVCPNFFSYKGKWKDGNFHTNDGQILTSIEAFYAFLKENPNVGIQDDWPRWFGQGEKQGYAKLFPIDLTDRSVISVFLDDHVSLDTTSGKNIVNPVEATTLESLDVPTLVESKRIFMVDTVEAIYNEDYFIQLIEQALQHYSGARL